ncbi:MAG: metal-dependent hydrolase [Marinosulfonomonas sp.]|nr:MAG: metal-dependent hydrolase [Marinosulfonomonas sp.]
MSTRPQFRIASYNVHKCVGLDGRRRPGRIIDVLNSLAADVVVLQEADRRLGERPAAIPARLIEDETDFRSLEISNSGPSIGWHGNAILVRKSINSSPVEQINLPGTEPRGALGVQVAGLRVIATHLGLLRSDRRAQLRAIRNHLNGDTTPAVILGDFNEWTRSRGLEPLADGFDIHSPGRSFHAARPVAALDRIATSIGLELRDAGVVQSRTARIASDHLPIWADIQIAG